MASAFFRTIIMATLPINAKTNSVDANEKTARKETDKQDAQYNKSNSMPQLRKTNQTESVSRTARFSVWAPMEKARLLCRDRCHLRRRRFAMVICLLKTMHIQPFLSTSTRNGRWCQGTGADVVDSVHKARRLLHSKKKTSTEIQPHKQNWNHNNIIVQTCLTWP